MQLQPYSPSAALEQAPEDYIQYPAPSLDCTCDRIVPWCPVCVVSVAAMLRYEHPLMVSVGMLKRRIPGLSGREAALLLEATKRLPMDLEAFAQEKLEAQPPRELPGPESSEPETEPPLVLMHSEARVLEMVRLKPGSTSAELSGALNRRPPYVGQMLRLLAIGGHARREDHRWYPTHDRPIGKVPPRAKVNWKREAVSN